MSTQKKPYLIIPKLIEQPTWGGTYILEMKGWQSREGFKNKKIGQSYELYGESELSQAVSSDHIEEGGRTGCVADFKEGRPFPLIKFTQARGNSFQLHIRQSVQSTKWKPKAESWFYLENGKITLGIKKGSDMDEYKNTCFEIESKMKELSFFVRNGKMKLGDAKLTAHLFIKGKNPWQFVNVLEVKRGDIIDLSSGGIHHSWEEDERHPLGNIVYEIQQDVDDASSTIRAFDQGKFKNDGGVRDITIEDYFSFLDKNEDSNKPNLQKSDPVHVFKTPYYCLDSLSINGTKEEKTDTSFHHLFVVKGEMDVRGKEGCVRVKKGHSCFIPQGIPYTIEAQRETELLKTFLS